MRDPDVEFSASDMVIVVVCDGFEQITEEFKKYALKYKLMDQRVLEKKGFYVHDNRSGKWKMAPLGGPNGIC